MQIGDVDDTITYRLSEDDAAELDDIAWQNGTTKSDILRVMTRRLIEDGDLRDEILDEAPKRKRTNGGDTDD